MPGLHRVCALWITPTLLRPREVGHYLPDPAPGADRASSNDATIDSRGIIYLVDRVNGVDLIEAAAMA